MGFSGSLTRMKITAFRNAGFTEKAGEFTVMINPEKYDHSYEICYNDVQAQGSNGGSPDFNRILSETIRLELVFDGTGVVPSPLPGVLPFTQDGIAPKIEAFKNLVFAYQGGIHSPNYLKLEWGTLSFQGRLEALDITYTLFKPDGTPLRARAGATFVQYQSPKELALKAKKTSPDLSHVLTVKAGDTLPLMCHAVYGSSAYYLQVARANGLTGFRDLAVGTSLLFPPLVESPA